MAIIDPSAHPIDPAEARLLISELQAQVSKLEGGFATLNNLVNNPPEAGGQNGSTPQAVNQIYNGTLSHSVNSWDNVLTANNGRYECAWWYSHPITDGQPMFKGESTSAYPTLTITSVSGNQITIAGHGLITGTAFRLSGSLPSPLAAATTYFAIRISDNVIEVASSYDNAVTGSEITLTTTTSGGTLTYNFTLKDAANTEYSEGFADWQISTGSARLSNDTSDLSCFLPGANAEAGYTYYAVFSIVRSSEYVSASPQTRIFAGLWGESIATGDWGWLSGDYEITALVLGTVATPTPREYAVFVQTNRGVTLITDTLTVAGAPSDADFATGARVFLSWPRPLGFGVTSYTIYRNTPTDFAPADVSVGNDYITITGINLTTGQPIVFTGADLPDPLLADTVYYAIRRDNNTFYVALSEADALADIRIVLIDAGTGTHTLNVYVRLFTQNGISYIDNGGFQSFASGFPVADFNELVAYTATSTNAVSILPFTGDPLFSGWSVIPFAIRMPRNYDKGDTDLDSGQWLRFGLTQPMDLTITREITMDFNSNAGVSAVGQFMASMIGLAATITNKAGDELITTITNVSDANNFQVADNWDFGTEATCSITVTGGAPPHSLMLDLLHLTWVEGAAFSPNAEDISNQRGNPAAVPNGTTQGPIIIGQTPNIPDGYPVCLYEEEMVTLADGDEIAAIALKEGMLLADGYGSYNRLEEKSIGVSDVWYLETENGAKLMATETKLIYVDHKVTKMFSQIKIGDTILTSINGELIHSPVTNKIMLFKKKIVVQIGLSPNHSFLAGTGDVKVLVDNSKPVITGGTGPIIGGPVV